MAGARVGGAEAFFERLVPALARAGLAQRAVIRHHPERAAGLEAAGVPVTQLSFGRRFDFRTRPALKRQVAAFRPHLVLAWMSRAASLLPAGKTLHLGRLGGTYDLKYYSGCDHLIGNTRLLVESFVDRGWPADRVHYLPNFVLAQNAPPFDRATAVTPAGAPLLLGLGRFHRNKGFDVLIRALARLPGVWLWLAGEGPERRALERLAAQLDLLDRVRFLGWRREVPALIAAADAVVCPSRRETFGNVVVEAWAQGRPVVGADAAGPRALIREGETGLLVPRQDHQALATALAELLDAPDLAARLAAGGRAAYEAEFTEAAVVRRYLELFARLADMVPKALRETASQGEGLS